MKLITVIKNIITENRVDFLRKKYEDAPFLGSEKVFIRFLNIDPTPNKIYLQWILRQYEKLWNTYKKLNIPKHLFNFWEDERKLNEYLDVFNRNKHRLEVNDINKYDLNSLADIAISLQRDMKNNLRGKERGERYQQFKIGNVEGFDIFKLPKGRNDLYSVSVELGKGTEWCTAYEPNERNPEEQARINFDDYINDGSLFIIISSANPSIKFQFHAESDSLMDADDINVMNKKNVKSLLRNIMIFIEENGGQKLSIKTKLYMKLPIQESELNVPGDLIFHSGVCPELPDNLIINGYLVVSGSSLIKLPNNLRVKNSLDALNTILVTLPNNLIVDHDLNIEGSRFLTSIPPDLFVGNNLNLHETKIESIPSTIKVGGHVYCQRTPFGSKLKSEFDGKRVKLEKEYPGVAGYFFY